MTDTVFCIPQRDEIEFSIEDGYICLSQVNALGDEPSTIRIHHLDAEWIISGLNAAVEAAKKVS
ncbi:hypothetical protein [Dryocola clanedunensis]